jgi:hypothetical protein
MRLSARRIYSTTSVLAGVVRTIAQRCGCQREQEYDAEDLERRYATTDPEESLDDATPIAKPRSNIKKLARIICVESKRVTTESGAKSVKSKLPTKRRKTTTTGMEQPAENGGGGI